MKQKTCKFLLRNDVIIFIYEVDKDRSVRRSNADCGNFNRKLFFASLRQRQNSIKGTAI